MIARYNGSFGRSMMSALALVLAAALPTFTVSTAFANPGRGKAAAGKAAQANDAGDSEASSEEADTAKPDKTVKKGKKHQDKTHAKNKDPYADGEGDADDNAVTDAKDADGAHADAKKPDADRAGKDAKHAAKDGAEASDGAKPTPKHKTDKRAAAAAHKSTSKKGKTIRAKNGAPGGSPKAKKGKKASRTGGKKKLPEPGADSKAPPARPCIGPEVTLDRSGRETEALALVDCHGRPRAEARERLSMLARPWGTARPKRKPARPPARGADEGANSNAKSGDADATSPPAAEQASRGVLDPGLLVRLDAIARKYPGKTISIVSGYRPRSDGSLHQSGRALDVRVAGVANAEVVAFCRTLADTGCGFYPNSSFMHVDVRPPKTGVVHWIDASGPGEAPRYVDSWPPPAPPPGAKAAPASDEAPHDQGPAPADPEGDAEDAAVEDSGDNDGGAPSSAPRLRGPKLLPPWDSAPRR